MGLSHGPERRPVYIHTNREMGTEDSWVSPPLPNSNDGQGLPRVEAPYSQAMEGQGRLISEFTHILCLQKQPPWRGWEVGRR